MYFIEKMLVLCGGVRIAVALLTIERRQIDEPTVSF